MSKAVSYVCQRIKDCIYVYLCYQELYTCLTFIYQWLSGDKKSGIGKENYFYGISQRRSCIYKVYISQGKNLNFVLPHFCSLPGTYAFESILLLFTQINIYLKKKTVLNIIFTPTGGLPEIYSFLPDNYCSL